VFAQYLSVDESAHCSSQAEARPTVGHPRCQRELTPDDVESDCTRGEIESLGRLSAVRPKKVTVGRGYAAS